MRKFFALVLGLSLASIMLYGAIGSGAQFLYTGTADQDINVGTLGFTLSSDTGTVVGDTVTCNPLNVMSSGNFTYVPQGTCHVTITTTGNIPAVISVFGKAGAASTFPAADLDHFVLVTGISGSWLSGGGDMLLSKTPVVPAWGFAVGTVASPATGNSVTLSFAYDWGMDSLAGEDLDNVHMGKTIEMTFTFSASA